MNPETNPMPPVVTNPVPPSAPPSPTSPVTPPVSPTAAPTPSPVSVTPLTTKPLPQAPWAGGPVMQYRVITNSELDVDIYATSETDFVEVQIRLEADKHFRVFGLDKATNQFSVLLKDLAPDRPKRVYILLTALVIASPLDNETMKFEFLDQQTSDDMYINDSVPIDQRNAIFDNTPNDIWLEMMRLAGFPATTSDINDLVRGGFKNYKKIMLWAFIAPLLLIFAIVIPGTIISDRHATKQHVDARESQHANLPLTLVDLTSTEAKLSMKVPDSYSVSNDTANQAYLSPKVTTYTYAVNDANSILLRYNHNTDQTLAEPEDQFLRISKQIVTENATTQDGVSTTVVSQDQITAGGHKAIKSVTRQMGTDAGNKLATDNTIVIVDVYIDPLTSYQFTFSASTHNTNFLKQVDPMIASFTPLP